MAQRVKHLPAVQKTWVQSLGREDPLEKEKAVHSNTLAWKIPWTEKPGRVQSIGLQRVGHNEQLHFLSIDIGVKSSIIFKFWNLQALNNRWVLPLGRT